MLGGIYGEYEAIRCLPDGLRSGPTTHAVPHNLLNPLVKGIDNFPFNTKTSPSPSERQEGRALVEVMDGVCRWSEGLKNPVASYNGQGQGRVRELEWEKQEESQAKN